MVKPLNCSLVWFIIDSFLQQPPPTPIRRAVQALAYTKYEEESPEIEIEREGPSNEAKREVVNEVKLDNVLAEEAIAVHGDEMETIDFATLEDSWIREEEEDDDQEDTEEENDEGLDEEVDDDVDDNNNESSMDSTLDSAANSNLDSTLNATLDSTLDSVEYIVDVDEVRPQEIILKSVLLSVTEKFKLSITRPQL